MVTIHYLQVKKDDMVSGEAKKKKKKRRPISNPKKIVQLASSEVIFV